MPMTCTLCGETVAIEDRRAHLLDHHPGAAHFTGREVAEFFATGQNERATDG